MRDKAVIVKQLRKLIERIERSDDSTHVGMQIELYAGDPKHLTIKLDEPTEFSPAYTDFHLRVTRAKDPADVDFLLGHLGTRTVLAGQAYISQKYQCPVDGELGVLTGSDMVYEGQDFDCECCGQKHTACQDATLIAWKERGYKREALPMPTNEQELQALRAMQVLA